ncbi:Mitotic checkpoint serine/threonine-protein kinase BUB1 [Nymphon striatum]|nr:Mitotic checkpoint serine/threonine-protein kinase BUB1 [Nymphon striatum]
MISLDWNSEQSIEVYTLMHQQNIGTEVALFYKTWAWEVECLGNSRKADGILKEGIGKNAQPLDELIAYHKKFQERMVKKINEDLDENGPISAGSDAQRKALCELKTRGKSSQAPVNRVGSSVFQNSTRPVSGVAPKLQSSSNSKKTQIFVDEDDNYTEGRAQASKSGGNIAMLPGSSETVKENAKKPGPWNKAKLKTKTRPPLSAFGSSISCTSTSTSASSVQIYVEEDDDEQKNDVKEHKPATFIIEPFDPTKRPMYDKWRVYGGPEEMSFEELRALKIEEKLKKHKEHDLREKVKLMEEKLYQKELLIQKLTKESTGPTNPEKKSQNSKEFEIMCNEMENVVVNDSENVEKPQEKISFSLDSGESHEVDSFASPFNVEEKMEHDGENYQFSLFDKKDTQNNDSHSGFQNKTGSENIPSVPKSSISLSQKVESDSTTSGPFTEMSMIRDLWNGSLVENVGQSWTDNELIDQQDLTYFKHPSTDAVPSSNTVGSKILIYTDEDDLKYDPNSAYDHDDKENWHFLKEIYFDYFSPPSKTQPSPNIRRNITGILTPSVDFPMAEPEEDNYSDGEDEEPMQHDDFRVDDGTPNHLNLSQITRNSGLVLTEVHPSAVALSSTRLEPSERLTSVERSKHIDLSSIIMEASHEYNSKSSISSNSSSGQMTNTLGASRIQSNFTKDRSFHTIHEDEVSKYNITSSETIFNMNDDVDPFDENLIATFLADVQPPLMTRSGYHRLNGEMSLNFHNTRTEIGGNAYHIKKMVAEGAYAKVYLAKKESENSNDFCILKVQKPSCYWEFYICDEIASRLRSCPNEANVLPSLASVDYAYFYNNGSILEMNYCPFGTLLDLVNFYSSKSGMVPIEFVIFLTIQILYILENLHLCNIIHADIKPDNIMITSIPSPEDLQDDIFGENRKLNLKLIDFGRSIDMSLFPSGTTFTKVITTEGFTSTEMKENKPWTYQTDLHGFLATVHVLLFNSYMDVNNKSGQWNINKKLKRYWIGVQIMEEMFASFLNIPDCESIPDIKVFRRRLEEVFSVKQNLKRLHECFTSLKNMAR